MKAVLLPVSGIETTWHLLGQSRTPESIFHVMLLAASVRKFIYPGEVHDSIFYFRRQSPQTQPIETSAASTCRKPLCQDKLLTLARRRGHGVLST